MESTLSSKPDSLVVSQLLKHGYQFSLRTGILPQDRHIYSLFLPRCSSEGFLLVYNRLTSFWLKTFHLSLSGEVQPSSIWSLLTLCYCSRRHRSKATTLCLSPFLLHSARTAKSRVIPAWLPRAD